MNKLNQILSFMFLFTSLFSSKSYAQISPKEVDQLVEKAMGKFNVAGLAVAIVKDGKIVHSKGYGVKSIITKEPVSGHTNFQIASNTKAFTTAALAILVEEGKLSWNDKVKVYLPEFKMYNDYVTENFNIQDLLTHRSGLGLGAGDLMHFPDGSDFTIKDVMSCFQYFQPVSAIRTHFDYDNLLYLLAGEVIARVSGMSWEAFVKSRILEPLQMNRSYSSMSGMNDNLSTSHSTGTGTIRTIGTFDPIVNGAAGGILSNVDDLCNWMLVQLNRGKYGKELEKQLFSEASQLEMWKIHTTVDKSENPFLYNSRYNTHFAGYGLGWDLSDVKGNLSVSHTGYVPGMFSKIWMIPDLNLGVVVLTNTEEDGREIRNAISQTIIDRYLGLADYDWVTHYQKLFEISKNKGDSVSMKVWDTVNARNNDKINVADYAGTYEDNWFGKIEIFVNGNQLWFKSYRSPKLNGPMRFYEANTFAIKWEYQDMKADALAIFSMDHNGKAQGIRMKGISPNIDFSFDFQDLNLERIKNR